jgi:hypothetical protein
MTGGIGNAAKRDKKMLRVCHAGKVDDVLAGIAADRATDYAAGSAQRGPARGNHRRFLTGKFFTSQIDSRLR